MFKIYKNVFIYMFFVQITLFFSFVLAQKDQSIRIENLRSIPWEDENWSADSLYEWAQQLLQRQGSPSNHRKRVSAFSAIEATNSTTKSIGTDSIITSSEWTDLEILCGNKNKKYYLGSILNRTQTELGYTALLKLLSEPTTDTQLLSHRQNMIKKLISSPDLSDFLSSCFTQLSKQEDLTLSFWHRNDGFSKMSERLYFSLPLFAKSLNSSVWALEIGNYFDKLSALHIIGTSVLVGAILPLWAMNRWGILPIPQVVEGIGDKFQYFRGGPLGPLFMVYDAMLNNNSFHTEFACASGLFALLSVKSQTTWQRDLLFVEQCLQKKLIAVARYFELVCFIDDVLIPYHDHIKHIPGYENFCQVMHILPTEDSEIKELYSLLKSSTFAGKSSVSASRGRILRTFKLLHEKKKEIKPIFEFIGNLDAFCSFGTLYKESKKHKQSWCFAQYLDQKAPYVALKQFWNPFISSHKVIANDLMVGERANTLIITGPNAGGKSTIMKAVALNSILAQTIGLAAAQEMKLSPFTKIITYMNIADDIGSGNSGFKAAVLKAQQCLKGIDTCNGHSLLLMDEAFRETNPIEAQAASYSVAKEIGSYQHNIALIATHFDKVATLADTYDNFTNYKVSVIKNSDGSLYYPYLFTPGRSNQHIALDILRNEGFSGSIIDTAQEVVDSCLSHEA